MDKAVVALFGAMLAYGTTAHAAQTWVLRTELWGNPAFSTLQLDTEGRVASGTLDGDAARGSLQGGRLRLDVEDRARDRFDLRLRDDRLEGQVESADPNDAQRRVTHAVTGWRLPAAPTAPRTLTYVPADYANTFDADRAPGLVIWPGDTVRTRTLDSGGVDEHGVTRALFGNPQNGPFFIAGAEPGDTVAVHIRTLALNRDYADSLDSVVGRALGSSLVPQAGELGKPVRWTLDRAAGVARPAQAQGALADFAVPLRPMLGGLALAPGFGAPAMSTGDTGRSGGNMDFNEVIAGNTVYLPVQQPGGLLYLGDAHALQGDGETSQYALETSMDVVFSVSLIKKKAIHMPRVESPTQIMVLGQAGSLDEALRFASTGLLQWLREDYGMTLSQAAQVLGSAVRYDIANLAGRSVGVSARLDKSLLPAPKRVLSVDDRPQSS
ncbi:acetamidase/formamidase family protein [Stenotrophomonas sp. HITSZ_GD]|uniref:acetamidase/formamidase family protein n=1 Tax=Stenotrophomonas sp. HITSZ_GD TaxID=3037248 RepID=UPI00240E041E|nr:acetamidase/formamidase family protein [Stenotrophomonas sp. HITSZ_GD]MDG2526565.1 acetamidase/formamidase family protein [Stenotrophomonas sp. HITSZ_GD]